MGIIFRSLFSSVNRINAITFRIAFRFSFQFRLKLNEMFGNETNEEKTTEHGNGHGGAYFRKTMSDVLFHNFVFQKYSGIETK